MANSSYVYIPISNMQLVFSVSLVLITGFISAFLKLSLLKPLLWGTIRAFIQLSLVGYILTYIFKLNTLLVIIPILLLMCFIASREATRRILNSPYNPAISAFISITISTFAVGLLVVVVIISPQPWYFSPGYDTYFWYAGG